MTKRVSLGLLISVALLVSLAAGVVLSNNKWSDYHWERIANPVTVPLGNGLHGPWVAILNDVAADWNFSDALDTTIIGGGSNCLLDASMVAGTVQVCSDNYQNTGWLGLATIIIDTSSHHIQSGTAQVNDYYFTGTRNNDLARQHVLCQEIFHTGGLQHQKGPNKRSCMNDMFGLSHPDFVSPNRHDYDTLEEIYLHLDGGADGGSDDEGGLNGPPCDKKPNHHHCLSRGHGNGNGGFGKAVGHDDKGRANQFEKALGSGLKRVTFVTWAD